MVEINETRSKKRCFLNCFSNYQSQRISELEKSIELIHKRNLKLKDEIENLKNREKRLIYDARERIFQNKKCVQQINEQIEISKIRERIIDFYNNNRNFYSFKMFFDLNRSEMKDICNKFKKYAYLTHIEKTALDKMFRDYR
ncbi:hypothetical protein [Heterosigma akashiwo virus 01]|uniref:Uncharacterized protein n=1 Tax=Heterosigma akashiwo virus 01 TaxID=97195 RepID=A0A1C9C5L6_HAV01|nr:hypothetical protein D1R72_gp244 [Heterosigma akashiwo virus 01]AOM63575.1 hypothetical protein [Heterosigma akashiwo virus 01]